MDYSWVGMVDVVVWHSWSCPPKLHCTDIDRPDIDSESVSNVERKK